MQSSITRIFEAKAATTWTSWIPSNHGIFHFCCLFNACKTFLRAWFQFFFARSRFLIIVLQVVIPGWTHESSNKPIEEFIVSQINGKLSSIGVNCEFKGVDSWIYAFLIEKCIFVKKRMDLSCLNWVFIEKCIIDEKHALSMKKHTLSMKKLHFRCKNIIFFVEKMHFCCKYEKMHFPCKNMIFLLKKLHYCCKYDFLSKQLHFRCKNINFLLKKMSLCKKIDFHHIST